MSVLLRSFAKLVAMLMAVGATIAFVAIAAAVGVTLTDIGLRTISRLAAFFFGHRLTWAIPGLVDLTQLFVVTAAALAIPVAFHRRAHVVIDLLDARLPSVARRFNACVAGLLSLVFFAACINFGLAEVQMQVEMNTASSTINIPYLWYWIPLLTGFVLSILGIVALLADVFAAETRAEQS